MKTQRKVRISRYLTSLIVLVAVLLSPKLGAQDNPGFVVDKIIAKVDNYIVLKSDLEVAYQNYLADGNPQSREAKCELLNRIIINKLMVAKAEIDSVVVTDDEVDQNTTRRMQLILQNSGNSPEELERAYGKTMDEIRLDLRDQIREQLLGNEMTQEITKDIAVTPAEVRRFFNKIPQDSLPYYSSDVEVAQIVRIVKVSEEQKNETRQKLSDIRDRLIKGEDFKELARKYSEDPSAQYNGGDMGYVGRGAMVPTYEATAFKLRPGEISQPFESPFGFHIMQLIERRGNEYNSRHILMSSTPSEEDISRTEKFMDSLRLAIVNDSITFEKAAKEYSDDQQTKGQGGFFTDADGGTKISIKEIDPVVYFKIDAMKAGDVSEPIKYRTDDGKDAVRIIYFKTKLLPHQANLKDDWHRIQAAALAEKKDRALDKWFLKARGDVFINIDPEYDLCHLLE
ncbi:MAG: peptidylprolyl isomerase [Cyclobacteriaceae bacterium]|nr:peptidylprolyl isomerase [Cyclobacteriaceae bacterium]